MALNGSLVISIFYSLEDHGSCGDSKSQANLRGSNEFF